MLLPTFASEQEFWLQGLRLVAGVDEAGRGPLAGPLFAAAVVLSPAPCLWYDGLRDSKLLTPNRRRELARHIHAEAIGVGIGRVEASAIDEMRLTAATDLAMQRALAALAVTPDAVLVDGRTPVRAPFPQRTVVDGDALCASVAAASIIAKVARDAEMEGLDIAFPAYGFAANKGYATPAHLRALACHGPCPQHRRSFAPVRLAGSQGGP